MARQKRKQAKRATSHSDFAGADPDTEVLGKLVAEAEKVNAKKHRDVKPEVIRHHIQQIAHAQAIADRAASEAKSKRKILSSKYKTAQIDGIDTVALKKAFIEAARPQSVVVAEQRNMRTYLIAMDVAVGHQWSMFDSPAVDVKAMGEHAGRNGEPQDICPHKPGTEEYVQWMDGYQVGQTSIAGEMRPN